MPIGAIYYVFQHQSRATHQSIRCSDSSDQIINSSALERKLFWRGDIIIVKAKDWPGQEAGSLPSHKNYHDVDLSLQSTAEFVIKDVYKTDDLRQWMKVMADVAQRSVQSGMCILHSRRRTYQLMDSLHPSDRFLRFGLQMQTEPIDINKRSE